MSEFDWNSAVRCECDGEVRCYQPNFDLQVGINPTTGEARYLVIADKETWTPKVGGGQTKHISHDEVEVTRDVFVALTQLKIAGELKGFREQFAESFHERMEGGALDALLTIAEGR